MIPYPSIRQEIARQRHGDRLRAAAQARLARTARLEREPSGRVAAMRLVRLLRLRRARRAAVVEPTPATSAE
jgi:hypothetical protein